ncbi:MAG: aminoglycoside phosphotransferase family protein [Saprospiraceae bacterium]|nr:aminoglycoside phosphotransferase family protein [Saprospiraceae bacterium]MBK9931800.1 aminoglycoside phosphotransferase family protein [Saprospiraceae bacterium]
MIPDELFLAYGLDPAADIAKFGDGLIHDTYLYVLGEVKLVIQRLNHHVFKDIRSLMKNIGKVEDHIRIAHPHAVFVSFLTTASGENAIEFDGYFWRIMHYIKNSHSYERLTHPDQAIEAGKMVGEFHSQLAGMNPGTLVDTIPSFHDLSVRYQKFMTVVGEDPCNRLAGCSEEVEFLKNNGEDVLQWQIEIKLPKRVTHNDTKLNNMLFDDLGKGICMVDLDTMMSGEIIFDTGDVLRTMCNPSGEDGRMGPVGFDTLVYHNFIKGYLSATTGTLTHRELLAIPDSMVRMALEQAIRFLTDHLEGDIYYKQPYAGFNLVSVQTQIAFIKLVSRHLPLLREELSDKLLKA